MSRGLLTFMVVVALAGCGATPQSLSSSDTGATGDASSAGNAAATTTSGGTTGAGTGTGTSGAASCGGAVCGTGTRCADFDGVGQACVCAPASDTQVDSCAANQDGRTVCDLRTLACRAPREYEYPVAAGVFPDGGGPNLPCDVGAGSYPIEFLLGTLDDGGLWDDGGYLSEDGGAATVTLCMIWCTTSADCTAATSCVTDPPLYVALDDGGAALFDDGGLDGDPAYGTPVGFCDVSLCGTAYAGDQGPLNGDAFAACDAHGKGDGTCLPLLGDLGLCVEVGDGGPCDADSIAGSGEGCPADAVCEFQPYGAPGATGACVPMCNAAPADAGHVLACASGACVPAFPDDGDGGLEPGLCE